MTIYSLDILLSKFGTSPLYHIWFSLMLLDLHTGFSGAGKVVWYFHLFKNFLHFAVIHTVKDFGVVNEAMFFWNSLAFSMTQWMVAIWSLVPFPFLKPAWTSGSSPLMYYWSLAWRILSITLLACEMSAVCVVVWIFFSIALLWDWSENWPFPVLWPLLNFPLLMVYWVQHFHSIIFLGLK